MWVVFIVVVTFSVSQAVKKSKNKVPRSLQHEVMSSVRSTFLSGIMGISVVSSIPSESQAAKGAFEMDAEYYFSNLMSKNKGDAAKTGTGRRPHL